MSHAEPVTDHPKPIALIPDNIPRELKQIRRWVVWKYEFIDGRWTKPPYRVSGNALASTKESKTWGTFEAVLKTYQSGRADGIGFVVTGEDDIVGIDLDHCARPLKPYARDIIAAMQSYTEVSPSGDGFRIFIKGRLPDGI